jgi:predicted lipoprotein with Yx(FWY)xxD motif
MRHLGRHLGLIGILAACFATGGAQAASSREAKEAQAREVYVREPMPPGFQVVVSEVDGPVFADAGGRTLYRWPVGSQRNGNAGEQKGKPTCDATKYTENAGLMSPYPGGLTLPEVETRPTCVDLWPPVYANPDDKTAGKWTVVKRPDGKTQWAYDGFALYRSVLDKEPGDVLGGVARGGNRGGGGDGGTRREPVTPAPNVPPGVSVIHTNNGTMLVTSDTKFSLYVWDKDGADKSKCDAVCLESWTPVLAPQAATPPGEWSIIERSPGVKQWAFRKRPLYTRIDDKRPRSVEGSDQPGWHNVYTQLAPKPPVSFSSRDTTSGVVLADARGHTIYTYTCIDDALDQQDCSVPDAPQAYRLAICSGGSQQACMQAFPYVMAKAGEKSGNRTWTVMDIDPKTGHRAAAGQADALHVWAYRGRPVYTFSKDVNPGDTWADGYGEHRGSRNGFKAFWLRDDFFNGAG